MIKSIFKKVFNRGRKKPGYLTIDLHDIWWVSPSRRWNHSVQVKTQLDN